MFACAQSHDFISIQGTIHDMMPSLHAAFTGIVSVTDAL